MSWCYCSGHMVEEGQPCHFDPDSACVGSECGDFVGHYDDDIDDFGVCEWMDEDDPMKYR